MSRNALELANKPATPVASGYVIATGLAITSAHRVAETACEVWCRTAKGKWLSAATFIRGGDIAVFATARKLAILIYRLLRWGQTYVDEGAEAYETRYRLRRIGRLTATAKELGYQLIAVNA